MVYKTLDLDTMHFVDRDVIRVSSLSTPTGMMTS